MPASKTKLPLLIGLGISAFFLWFAMRDTNLGDIWNALAQANLIYAFPLLLAFYGQLWIKAVRWATLITPIRQANAREVFPAAMVGHMGNMILPVYLDELVRVVYTCAPVRPQVLECVGHNRPSPYMADSALRCHQVID
jgi:uncharacterized membrane protein YbhN (UPF0104 family)